MMYTRKLPQIPQIYMRARSRAAGRPNTRIKTKMTLPKGNNNRAKRQSKDGL